MVRARVHSPAACCARAAASARLPRASRALSGVKRKACSESSARDSGGAALGGKDCGLVELRRDVGVGLVTRERQVARTHDWVVDDLCDARMDTLALLTEVVVERRRQQRVREANRPVVALDDVRGQRGIERALRNAHSCENVLGRCSECRHETERIARSRREAPQPHTDEAIQGFRHGKRLQRVDVALERAGDLERKERVSSRPLVDPEERLTRECPTQPVAQQPMNRSDTQRSDLDALRREGRLQARTARLRRRAFGQGGRGHSFPRAFGAQKPGRPPTTGRATGRRRPRSRPARVRSARPGRHARRPPVRGDRQDLRALRRAEARPRVHDAEEARELGSTSSRTSSNRSPSPACARLRSASDGRAARTRIPRARACSTPASQSVDLPIPGSPSSTSAVGPPSSCSTNVRTAASSVSLPTISRVIVLRRWLRNRAR